MKIFVTGGAGFIGSHLCDRYLESGHEVFAIDNFATGSYENIRHLKDNPHFHFREASIFDEHLMLEMVGTCDVVLHMAAAVGVQYLLDNPLISLQTNIKGTELILELCAKFRKKVLIASTSEVYGKHTKAPLRETEDSIFGPSTIWRWSYAASKLIDEYAAFAYHRQQNLPVIIVRLFNTVGPRQSKDYGMVLPRFIYKALKGQPLPVYGDGQQSRTFTYVDEVVTAITKLIDTSKAIGEVVNIGGVEEITILDLAKKVIKKTNSRSEIQVIPYDQAFEKDFEDMKRRVPSLEKLESIIEWKPIRTLDMILEDTIKFTKNQIEQERVHVP